MAQVLAGKVKGPPVSVPGKLKAGPPKNGMSLPAMALTPKDLGAGKVAQQGYKLDTDSKPISEFSREISGGPFTAFGQRVELLHSPTEAGFTLTVLSSGLSSALTAKPSARGSRSRQLVAYTPTKVAVKVGDEARAILATARFANGAVVNEGFVIVRVGSVVSLVSVATPAGLKIPRAALVGLAQLTAARMSKGLNKTPVA